MGYPVDADQVLETNGLRWTRAFDPDELVIRVGAGITAHELSDRLRAHRLRAIVPEDPPERTIGGIIATGSSGFGRLRYGPIRNHVIGITIVTGTGDAVSAGGQVVKNVTGFDLARLCVGSFGRLGVIVEVALRVYARRGEDRVLAIPDPEPAWRMADRPLAVIATREQTLAWVDGSAAAIEALRRRLDAKVVDTPLPNEAGWRWRATLRTRPSQQPQLAAALPHHWRYITQFGTGIIQVGGDRVEPREVASVRARVEEAGGRLVIHGWADEAGPKPDPWGAPPAGLDIQQRLVQSFDPAGVLNPGILPGRL